MDLAAAATEAAFGFVSHDGCAIIEHVARDWQAACCIDRGSDETSIGDGKIMQDRGESFMPQAQDQVQGKRIRMSGKVVLRSIKRVNSARSHHTPALQISILSRAK